MKKSKLNLIVIISSIILPISLLSNQSNYREIINLIINKKHLDSLFSSDFYPKEYKFYELNDKFNIISDINEMNLIYNNEHNIFINNDSVQKIKAIVLKSNGKINTLLILSSIRNNEWKFNQISCFGETNINDSLLVSYFDIYKKFNYYMSHKQELFDLLLLNNSIIETNFKMIDSVKSKTEFLKSVQKIDENKSINFVLIYDYLIRIKSEKIKFKYQRLIRLRLEHNKNVFIDLQYVSNDLVNWIIYKCIAH